MVTQQEVQYLRSQRLGRSATASPPDQPDAAPVGFAFDGARFTIVGYDRARTLTYRNVQRGNPPFGFVVDNLASIQPWTPRGSKVYGTAEIIKAARRSQLLLTPLPRWSWGINAPTFSASGRPQSDRTTAPPLTGA